MLATRQFKIMVAREPINAEDSVRHTAVATLDVGTINIQIPPTVQCTHRKIVFSPDIMSIIPEKLITRLGFVDFMQCINFNHLRAYLLEPFPRCSILSKP